MSWFALSPALIVVWMAAHVWLPWGGQPRGVVVWVTPLSLLARLRLFGRAASIGLALVAAGSRLGWIDLPIALALAVALLVVPALPNRYVLTSEGIGLGHAVFRRWTEFGGVGRRPGGIRLGGVAGGRGMTVWLSGGRDDDAFVLLVRRLLRGSYKGQDTGAAAPGAWTAPTGEPLRAVTS
ncbi:MAG TPA: hypothetical protein VFI22_19705 [Thermomicrobiales bacterium]|nr:hypothetical protein [Thermomicrobiales bacterium]